MAEPKETKGPDKTVQATSTKAKLSPGKSKTNNLGNVKARVFEKPTQSPTIVNRSKKGTATPRPTAQNSRPKTKTSPFIPGKEPRTSYSVVRRKDKPVHRSPANTASTVTFGKLELLDLRMSIGLLFMLNETPQEASTNEIPAFLKQEDQRSSARVLTLSREKELAGIFAFLVGVEDDPRKVAALCLEESLNHKSLSIKIAANHGDLMQTKEGLDRIARILKACHEDTTADLQGSLLETIVALHQNRILCRLRSCHGKAKSRAGKQKLTKPKILPALVQSFTDETTSGKSLNSLTSDITELANLSTELESLEPTAAASEPGLQVLLSILQTTHQLCHNSDFDALQLSEALRLSLAKLSRYVSASVDLIRAARRYGFFADVSVDIVKLEPLPNVPYTPQQDFFESLITRLSLNTTPTELLSCLDCRAAASEPAKRAAAAGTLCGLMNADCPVHAEIQLLFYYELRASKQLIPRVICSTKSACYLCNLFFSFHGRFYIPSTHGRVYEKWALPNGVRDLRGSWLSEVIVNFFDAVVEVIRQLLPVPSRKPRYPNESAYFFRSGIWSSLSKISQRSLRLGQGMNFASRSPSIATQAATPDTSPHQHGLRGLKEGGSVLDIPSPSTSASERIEKRPRPSSCAIKTSTTAVPRCAPASHRLKPGMSVILELGDLSYPITVETANMDIDLTRDISISDISTSNNEQRRPATERAWAAVDMLSTSEDHSRIYSSGVTSIDVVALAPGAHVTLDQQVVGRGLCGFYVVCDTDTLLIRCWKGEGSMDVE